jgi:hypothetical protein
LNPGDPATANASLGSGTIHFLFALPRGNDGPPGATGGPGPQGLQGLQGDVGPQGPLFTNFNINATVTLDPGQPASVQTFFDGAAIRFTFGIPRGQDGSQGPVGATGPAFTSFTVDSVTTLGPGEPATVVATLDAGFVRFAFGIPQGQQGPQGNPGLDGATGPQGPQGPQGEVTAAQLATAIAGTPSNTNPIATLDIAISDPPTQSELQQVLAKLNELIVGLRR